MKCNLEKEWLSTIELLFDDLLFAAYYFGICQTVLEYHIISIRRDLIWMTIWYTSGEGQHIPSSFLIKQSSLSLTAACHSQIISIEIAGIMTSR